MTNPDPNARPPFRQHPYYYPVLKGVVLVCAAYFAARFSDICDATRSAHERVWIKAGDRRPVCSTLIDAGDADGATNRAYYAIFGRPGRHWTCGRRWRSASDTRRSCVGSTSISLPSGLDRSFGKAFFHRQQNARWIADYDGSVGPRGRSSSSARWRRYWLRSSRW